MVFIDNDEHGVDYGEILVVLLVMDHPGEGEEQEPGTERLSGSSE